MSDLFAASAMSALKTDTMKKAKGDGCHCPTCGQFVKVYKRTITSTMARQLIHAWKNHGSHTWFHTRDVVFEMSAGAGDFSKLEMWGLICRREHDMNDSDKKSSGYWFITEAGEDFVLNQSAVQQYAVVYNGTLLEFEGEKIRIYDSLGKHFSYSELMAR